MVDGARVIKRMRPAPQGRGYRVRKRSNHVSVIVDTNAVHVKPVAKAKVEETVAEVVEEKATTKKTTTKKAAAPKKAKTATKK